MKKVLLLLSLFVLSFALIGCEQDTRKELIVGMEADYAPFNWMEMKKTSEYATKISGQPGYADGYDVVIAKYIADNLNRKLVIKAIEWDGLIISLQNGDIDLIVAGMSPTSERALEVDFSTPYYLSENVIIVRKDSPYANATSINDFGGAKVIAQKDTIQDDDEIYEQLVGSIRQTPLESYAAITQSLLSGVSDAFLAEMPVAKAVTGSNDKLIYLTFEEGNGFDILEENLQIAVALRKGNTDLVDEINAIIATITNEQKEQWMLGALERQSN